MRASKILQIALNEIALLSSSSFTMSLKVIAGKNELEETNIDVDNLSNDFLCSDLNSHSLDEVISSYKLKIYIINLLT